MDSSIQKSKPLYNSRIIDNYIRFIRQRYSHVDVNELLAAASMKLYEVADQNHWFTQEQINRFHEKLAQVTKNENIAREAGRYAASPESSGVMRQYFLGLLGPEAAYKMVGKAARNFTKSTSYKAKRISPTKVEVVVSPLPGVKERPFQCENRTGMLEAVAILFQNRVPKVEHPECIHQGGKGCRYIFTFEKTVSTILKKIRNLSAFILFPACLLLSFINAHLAATLFLPVSVGCFLILSLIASYREQMELRHSLNSLKNSTDLLIEQMEINYNNALMTNEIGQSISKQADRSNILVNIAKVFKKRLDYDRCMILLADKKKKRLLFRAGFGYTQKQLQFLHQTAFHLDKPKSKGVFIVSFKEQRPFLINDLSQIEKNLSIKSLVFAKKLKSHGFICCPIVSDGKSIGVLAVDNIKSKRPLVNSDLSLLIGLASVIGISLRNAELLETKERQFRAILHTLAASIDARDPMTSGHSERVTRYALGICEELALGEDYCKMIQVAALLHDYGKIGIPDTILKKKGKLTKEEHEIVKTHADKTWRILNQISFDGIFRQVPEIAAYHHEKLDGSGYPKGLKGKDIPLGARIIAVADFFEAITARRHYRGPLPIKLAFEMLKKESGKAFDTDVVEAFLRYYSKIHAGEPEYRIATM